jgi:hypothetical protein
MNKKTAFSVIAKLFQNMVFRKVFNDINVQIAIKYSMLD